MYSSVFKNSRFYSVVKIKQNHRVSVAEHILLMLLFWVLLPGELVS